MILSLETSSVICGASLHEDGECIAETYLKEPRVHAEKLAVLVEKLFDDQKIRIQKLQAIVVSAGPGSFTGLRIGMSFAKGLAYPHQIPLQGVNTMKAFIAGTRDAVKNKQSTLWIIRSHRDYIYMAVVDSRDDDISISYGRINDVFDRHPDCKQIICNDELNEIDNIPVIEKDILPSMIGNYYLNHMDKSATTDYDSLVLEYGMAYKPKEWNPGT